MNILFAAKPQSWAEYEAPLRAALEARGMDHRLSTDLPPEDVDVIVYAPNGPVSDFSRFPKLRAVLNLWAGVEDVVGNATLTVPLCRMVGGGLTEGMVEWVAGHVLRYHLGLDGHITRQDGVWRSGDVPPLAQDRTVGILGLGALGAACGQALAGLGFHVVGWSRTAKSVDGVTTFHGPGGLTEMLARSDMVVLLLPLTPHTENVLNTDSLALLPKGAFVINPGRGPLIDDDALLAALNRGQVAHATLDVFREEPLPPAHAYWAHPNVTVTPHIASETRVGMAVQVIAENVARCRDGLELLHQVDRSAGY